MFVIVVDWRWLWLAQLVISEARLHLSVQVTGVLRLGSTLEGKSSQAKHQAQYYNYNKERCMAAYMCKDVWWHTTQPAVEQAGRWHTQQLDRNI